MTLNPNWPLLSCQVAFNAGVATPAPSLWSDLTSRLWSFGCDRGKQYELDQNETGTGQIVFADRDEVLNPTNPSSPYFPNVLPYRQISVQAMWPPAPVGAATNLLWGQGLAPGFEGSTVGAAVPWISAVGGTSPVAGSTTPHSGTRDLSYSVAASATQQGVSWPIICIPGQQYTETAWVQQSSASTQQIGVTNQTLGLDAFNRTLAAQWGTGDVGGAWTVSGVSSSEFSTSGGFAYQSNTTTAAQRTAVIGSMIDGTVTAKVTIPVVATGGPLMARVLLRYVDPNNFYYLEARGFNDQSVQVSIWKVVAGTSTQLAVAGTSAPFSYSAGTQLWMRFSAFGQALSGAVWLDGGASQFGATLSTTDASLSSGAVGLASILHGSFSNTLPVTFAWSNFYAVGAVYGTSTTTTGTWTRLSVTFTATQIRHAVQLSTTGTAVAGTVLVDDLQHETGATATAFASSGPTIYGVHRGLVERWPSTWKHQGMYGYAQTDTVDAFAALAARKLHTEYRNAVMAKFPDYYWPLSEPQGATSFAEASGNGGPSLLAYKVGGGSTLAAGTSTAIAGDPSGVGAAISGNTTTVSTDLEAGPAGQRITIGARATDWGMTVSMWLSSTDTTPNNIMFQTITAGGAPGPALVNLLGPLNPNFGIQSSGGIAFCNPTAQYGDGKWHHYVGTVSQVGGNTLTLTLYIDNVQVATTTVNVAATFGTATPDFRMQWAQLAGMSQNGSTFLNHPVANGNFAHYALWRRALSATDVNDLWNAGKGYPGETSGARINRYVGYGNQPSPGLASSVDTGQSVMGVSNLAEGTILLDACLAVATTENGNFFYDGSGTVTFASRTSRYLATSAQWVFGENTAGGEAPYMDDIAYDYDPTQIYNDVQVANASGITAEAQDATSRVNYGPRTYQRSVNLLSDNEAVDASTWLLATHKDPHQRIATLTIKPSANPALWPVALGAEIGNRVTVVRRTISGYTMSSDYFIEQISHSQTDEDWTVQFQMSPAFRTQVWILGDSTYGVLDSTTVLAY